MCIVRNVRTLIAAPLKRALLAQVSEITRVTYPDGVLKAVPEIAVLPSPIRCAIVRSNGGLSMKTSNRTALLSCIFASAPLGFPAFAQTSDKHQHSDTAAPADLGAELQKLQGQVAELEAALATQHRDRYGTTSTAGQPAMSSMKKMGGMGMGMMSGMKDMSQDSGSQMSGMGIMGMNPATSSAEREIAEAKQELWKLTAADEPTGILDSETSKQVQVLL